MTTTPLAEGELHGAVRLAADHGARHLRDLQGPEGYWWGELESNASITAEQLFLLEALNIASDTTKIIPGHGPVGSKADLQRFHDVLSAIRDKVAALKAQGLTEKEAAAKKPTAEFDSVWGHGILTPDQFVGIVYRTI